MLSERPADRLSTVITSTVAEREGVDIEELPEPLYETINPEALATLFQNGPGRVTFEYLGYHVTVDHEDNVRVASVEDH